jgi:broad specificity phosphatase PhoE
MPKNQRTEFYLWRHAESKLNVQPHIVGGQSNEIHLTDIVGVEQAKRLGRVLLTKRIFPTHVSASPARRTIDTGGYSLTEMGYEDIEINIDPALLELSQGVTEGQLRDEVYTEEVMKEILKLGKDFKHEGGESMNNVGLRAYNWIMEKAASTKPNEPQRHFVYTSGGTIRYLASHILGWDHITTYETPIDNTSGNLFVIENGICRVEYLNRDVQDIEPLAA